MDPKPYSGRINTYSLVEGAKKARGTAVIIDVLRAFSLEPYLYSLGASEIRPVGTTDEAFLWKMRDPDCILAGERGGRKCEGFDLGNSPSAALKADIAGRRVIHTTSAGTKGLVNAVCADELLTGSFVNAGAVAEYIRKKNPPEVSLVCMGNSGIRPAKEDELCAGYIRSLLLCEPFPELENRLLNLRFDGGDHFFDPGRQDIYPEQDFWLCIRHDIFPFVLRVEKDETGLISKKISV